MTKPTKKQLAQRLAETEAALAAMRAREATAIVAPPGAAAQICDLIGDAGCLQEHFVVLALNARSKIIASQITAIGSVAHVDAHPRDVFRFAIAANAHVILIGHCHPSGDVEASEADVELTRRMIECGRFLGIPVVDHVIVDCANQRSYFSFSERGLLFR